MLSLRIKNRMMNHVVFIIRFLVNQDFLFYDYLKISFA